MVNMMEASVSEVPNKRSESKEKPAVTAVVRARDMLCELSGPRGWNDTRESWLSRGARRAGLSLRRARAIFYCEPIRLEADEYLGIERAWADAGAAVETLQHLARGANVRADQSDGTRSGSHQGKGGRTNATARGEPATTPAARR